MTIAEAEARAELEKERNASREGRELPLDLVETIYMYVLFGYSPGGFFESVLKNDLFAAVGYCSETRRPPFFDLVTYIKSRLPGDCYGSPQIVDDWMRRGGKLGRQLEKEG